MIKIVLLPSWWRGDGERVVAEPQVSLAAWVRASGAGAGDSRPRRERRAAPAASAAVPRWRQCAQF